MSFSSETKAELCRDIIANPCCAKAECYGILLYANLFSANEIKIVTGAEDFAKRIPKLFKKAFSINLPLSQREKNGKYSYSIKDLEQISKIFSSFGYDASFSFAHHINLAELEETCCRLSFLRGAFLAGGSVSDPNKSYHLELVTDHFNVSREVFSLLLEQNLSPKEISRNGNYITYFKNSTEIEDFLTHIGASLAAMNIMNAKVEKSMRNTINRKVNCDSANADKIVNAAEIQLEAIKKIEKKDGLDSLDEKLKQVALLRIANPAASLKELSMLSMPSVSKSGISHRLRKIIEIADK